MEESDFDKLIDGIMSNTKNFNKVVDYIDSIRIELEGCNQNVEALLKFVENIGTVLESTVRTTKLLEARVRELEIQHGGTK